MNHIIQKTKDGSHTIYLPELDEHYHSTNGAIQEAQHVYIQTAYNYCAKQDLTVLEIGFGTGLNALLTAIEATQKQRKTYYVSIEKFPLKTIVYSTLNYPDILGLFANDIYHKITNAPWDTDAAITEFFTIRKCTSDLTQFPRIPQSDVIYFDAFAPNKQAEMWTSEIFSYLYAHTNEKGILSTYCAKGSVRRSLQNVGYRVERREGPPGKREILRAMKIQ